MMPVSSIEDQLGIGSEPRELIIGRSFHKLASEASSSERSKNHHAPIPSGDSFHTLRCDFKPASVDVSKMALMEFSQNNDKVTVTVPNVEASNQPETIFTGSKKAHLKECVLIIDHETGEIRLERLTHSINVKKTRVEGSSRSQPLHNPSSTPASSPAPSSGQNSKQNSASSPAPSSGQNSKQNSASSPAPSSGQNSKQNSASSPAPSSSQNSKQNSASSPAPSSSQNSKQNSASSPAPSSSQNSKHSSTPASSPAPSSGQNSKQSRLPPPDDIDDFLSF